MTPYYHEYEDLQINNGIRNFPLFFQAWYTAENRCEKSNEAPCSKLKGNYLN